MNCSSLIVQTAKLEVASVTAGKLRCGNQGRSAKLHPEPSTYQDSMTTPVPKKPTMKIRLSLSLSGFLVSSGLVQVQNLCGRWQLTSGEVIVLRKLAGVEQLLVTVLAAQLKTSWTAFEIRGPKTTETRGSSKPFSGIPLVLGLRPRILGSARLSGLWGP